MQKITKILEAKNIEFYNNGCIKSVDNADNFLLKFETEDFPKLKLILDEEYNNNFSFSVYKDYVSKDTYHSYILIEGGNTQNFAILGVK